MKDNQLIMILEQRKRECKKHLESFQNQLNEIRNEPEIGYDREILGTLQHPIGYMTGVISEIENTIGLIKMSIEEYQEKKKLMKKYEDDQRKQLKSILRDLDN